MTSKKHYIHVTLEAGILKVILKDPETKNAMGSEMAEQLINTLNDFSKDSQSKVLMITGDKESFCSGANVRTMKANADSFISESTLDTDPWKQLEKSIKLNATEPQSDEIEIVRNITRHIFNLRKPSVAAVNGPAIGFGTGLALSCDIRLASTNAIFREAFVNVCLIPAD